MAPYVLQRRVAPAVVAPLVLVLALGAGCRKADKQATPPPTSTTVSTFPPGTGLAGVPAVGGGATATTVAGGCLEVPERGGGQGHAAPGLPSLPAGTRWLSTEPAGPQTFATAAVPEALPDMQKRVGAPWRAEGWRELAGESEPGREIEGVFQKDRSRLGLRARVAYCDKGWIEVRFVVAS